MWLQFAYTNIHFCLNIFAGFVFFLIAWLFLDAWISRKAVRNIGKSLGFLLLSLSFFAHATVIETGVIESLLIRSEIVYQSALILKISGLILIIVSLIIDPLQKRPTEAISKTKLAVVLPPVLQSILLLATPILSSVAALLFLRQATLGYENHLKRLAVGLFVFSLSELFGLFVILRESSNNFIFNFVAPYHAAWLIEHILLGLSVLILGLWAGSYLLKRLQSQLFIFFTTFVVIIFLITTVTFTGLLLKDLQLQSFMQSETNGKVLEYALEAKGNERVSNAQGFAGIPGLSEQILEEDRESLFPIAEQYMLSKTLDALYVLNSDGKVVISAHDRGEYGQSLSDNPFFLRGREGESVASFRTEEEGVFPGVSVVAVAPVLNEGGEIAGVVLVSSLIDNAFVDGIHTATGLSASVYSADTLSATSLSTHDQTRANGTMLSDEDVVVKVLENGELYSGVVTVLNTDYVASVLPLRDINEKVIGMVFVGEPRIHLLRTAGQSIELTFIVGAFLILLSTIPSMVISRKISQQIK